MVLVNGTSENGTMRMVLECTRMVLVNNTSEWY